MNFGICKIVMKTKVLISIVTVRRTESKVHQTRRTTADSRLRMFIWGNMQESETTGCNARMGKLW